MSFKQFQVEFEALAPLLDRFGRLFSDVEQLIRNLSRQPAPSTLFHYTSAQGLEGIVANGCFWATDCRFLNDSQEMKDGLRVVADHLSTSSLKMLSSFSEFLNGHGAMLAEMNSPHVVSFCAESDLLSQWRGYGSEASGYCLELDVSDSRLAACQDSTVLMGFLLPVIYRDSDKREIVDEVVRFITDALVDHGLDGMRMNGVSETAAGIVKGLIYTLFTLPMLSFKHEGFCEEREWRAVFYPNVVEAKKLRRFRSSSGIFVPYLEAIFLQGDSERLLQREIFPLASVRLPPSSGETARLGLEMYLQSRGFNVGEDGVQVRASSIPLRGKGSVYW